MSPSVASVAVAVEVCIAACAGQEDGPVQVPSGSRGPLPQPACVVIVHWLLHSTKPVGRRRAIGAVSVIV